MARTVLCIDDDPVVLSWIASTLGQDPDWDVITSLTLADGLAAYQRDPADVVLLDLSLPDSAGGSADLVTQVLAWQPRPAVVVLTSEHGRDLAREAIDRGAQDYVDKRSFTTPVVTRVLDYAHRRHAAMLRTSNRMTDATDPLGAVSQYVSALWHDLRSPVAAMVSMAGASRQLLELDAMPIDTLRELTRRTIELGHRALDFTDETLAGVGEAPVGRSLLDLPALCEQAWALAVHDDDATLDVQVEATGIYGLEPLLRQVLVNLFANAARYVGAGGRVLVDSDLRDTSVRIRVHDSGPGVAPEDRARVFQPGVTDGSSGLGLATVARQMARQDGRVWVTDSQVLGGAMFVLELPHRQLGRSRVPKVEAPAEAAPRIVSQTKG